jgi:hypothetical protein
MLHSLPHFLKGQTKAPPIGPLNECLIDHERPVQVWDDLRFVSSLPSRNS